jgi:hypothetical protein
MARIRQGSKQSAYFRGVEVETLLFRRPVADANSAGRVLFEKVPIDRGLQDLGERGPDSVNRGTR